MQFRIYSFIILVELVSLAPCQSSAGYGSSQELSQGSESDGEGRKKRQKRDSRESSSSSSDVVESRGKKGKLKRNDSAKSLDTNEKHKRRVAKGGHKKQDRKRRDSQKSISSSSSMAKDAANFDVKKQKRKHEDSQNSQDTKSSPSDEDDFESTQEMATPILDRAEAMGNLYLWHSGEILDAIANGDVRSFEEEISSSTSTNRIDKGDLQRDYLLHHAARGGQRERVALLQDSKGDIEVSDESAIDELGSMSLVRAASEGQFETVKDMAEHGAHVDQCDPSGDRALHRAAERGRAEIVKLLVSLGANLVATNTDGDSPIELAAQWEQSKAVLALLEAERIRSGIESQIEFHRTSINGETQVHYLFRSFPKFFVDSLKTSLENHSILRTQEKIMAELLYAGDRLHEEDREGIKPIFYIMEGSEWTFQKLRERALRDLGPSMAVLPSPIQDIVIDYFVGPRPFQRLLLKSYAADETWGRF